MTNNIKTVNTLISSWYADVVSLKTDLASGNCDLRIYEKIKRVIPLDNPDIDDFEEMDRRFCVLGQTFNDYTEDDMTVAYYSGTINLEIFHDWGYGSIKLRKSLKFDRSVTEDIYYYDGDNLTFELGFRFVYEYNLCDNMLNSDYRGWKRIPQEEYLKLRSRILIKE